MKDRVQLTLALNGPPDFSRDAFLLGDSNRHAFAMIENWPDWRAPVLVVVGPRGSGKSHLSAIWASNANAVEIDETSLSEGQPVHSNVVIDNIRVGAVPERDLFHMINRARETGTSLLLVSRDEPANWQVSLPDLASRLREATLARLDPPDDDLLRQLLVKLFADRQLLIDQSVVDYLIRRMERSFAAATDLVQLLDEKALAEGRRVSRVLAADILDELESQGAHSPSRETG